MTRHIRISSEANMVFICGRYGCGRYGPNPNFSVLAILHACSV